MTKRQLAIFAVGAFALTACNSLTPEQKAALTDAFQQQVETGALSQEQADLLKQTVSIGTFDWQKATDILVNVGLSIVGALTGVRLWRGSVHNRKGEIPTS